MATNPYFYSHPLPKVETDSDNHQPVIFYADDDLDDIGFFKDAAQNLEATVKVFHMGESMLDAMYNPPPQADLVFVDLNMPIKSGFEIIREIKGSPFINNIPVIVLSTAADPKTINQAMNIGADYFITKPSSPEGLQNALSHVLSINWKEYDPASSEFVYKTVSS